MVISKFKLPTGTCPKCGATGRFVAIERVESDRNANLLIFECEGCGEFTLKKNMHEHGGGRIYRGVKAPRGD